MALRGTLIIQAGGALNHMIPKWISFFPCEIPKIRSHALACITHYIEFKVCLFVRAGVWIRRSRPLFNAALIQTKRDVLLFFSIFFFGLIDCNSSPPPFCAFIVSLRCCHETVGAGQRAQRQH